MKRAEVVLIVISLSVSFSGCLGGFEGGDCNDETGNPEYSSPSLFINSAGNLDLFWFESLYEDRSYDEEVCGGFRYMELDPWGNVLQQDTVILDARNSTTSGFINNFHTEPLTNETYAVFMDSNSYYSSYDTPFFIVNGTTIADQGQFSESAWTDTDHQAVDFGEGAIPMRQETIVRSDGNVTFFDIVPKGQQRELKFELFSSDKQLITSETLESNILSRELATDRNDDDAIFTIYQDDTASVIGGKLTETTFTRTTLFEQDLPPETAFSGMHFFNIALFNDMVHVVDCYPDGALWYRQYDLNWTLLRETDLQIISGSNGFDLLSTDTDVQIVYTGREYQDQKLRYISFDHTGAIRVPSREIVDKTYEFRVCSDKPVVYLYSDENETDDVIDTITVELPGMATVTIPEVPHGRTITWENVGISPDGTLTFAGLEYPYLFYEGEFRPLFSDMGWKVERRNGQLYLDDDTISYPELRDVFTVELSNTGLFENEVDDFMDYWFDENERFFFDHADFAFAVMYIPQTTIEEICPIHTEYEYDSIVRVFLSVVPYSGATLSEPVFPHIDSTGSSALHEWGVVEGFAWEPDLE